MITLIWAVLSPLISIAETKTVWIKAGAELYSAEDLASGARGRSWNPWSRATERCVLEEDMEAVREGGSDAVVALRVTKRPPGCSRFFRAFDREWDKVFVGGDHVENDRRPGDTEAGVRLPGCPGCEVEGKHDDLTQVMLAGMANSRAINAKQPEKTPEELETYLACYKSKYQANYDRLYRRLFDLVGRTAQVTYEPGAKVEVRAALSNEDVQRRYEQNEGTFWLHAKPSALKCVSRRESEFNPAARGQPVKNKKTGQVVYALGIGQQMPVAVREMNCALNGCVQDGRTRKPKAWVQAIWKQIFKNARQAYTAAEYKELMTNAVTGQPCFETMEDQERDAACPINSIATLAIAQLEGALTIRRADGRHEDSDHADYGGRQEFDLTVTTASSNHAGFGTTNLAVRSTTDTSQWTKALVRVGKSHETEGNTSALINCLQSGNFKPPWTMKPGENARNCAQLRQAAAK